MSATPHAHAIRLLFVQTLILTYLLTSFHGPPCVADGDPMFVATSRCILRIRLSSLNQILAPKTSGVMFFASTPLPTSSLSCLVPFPSVDASPLRRPH
ncbi:hypothetical protein MTO96_045813 [Rhipicephalus appendiculatus]